MTEFNVLKYAAAAVLLVLTMGFLLLWDSVKGFSAALSAQSWLFVGIPLQILYTLVGYFVGLSAMLALVALTAVFHLAQLWLKDAPRFLTSWCYGLREYHRIRVHQPAH
jgi:hypothetical protein